MDNGRRPKKLEVEEGARDYYAGGNGNWSLLRRVTW